MCSALRAEQNPAAKAVLKAVLAQASEPTPSFKGLMGSALGWTHGLQVPEGCVGPG